VNQFRSYKFLSPLSVGSDIAVGDFIIFPNKVGKSRGNQSDHKKKERKTFCRAASAKEIVLAFTERRLDSTDAMRCDAMRCDAMRNWIGTLLSFRTFEFRLPSTNNGHPDARATGGGEFAFQIFVLLARGRPTTIAADQ